MHRPQKGNSGVLYNDALLDLRHYRRKCTGEQSERYGDPHDSVTRRDGTGYPYDNVTRRDGTGYAHDSVTVRTRWMWRLSLNSCK